MEWILVTILGLALSSTALLLLKLRINRFVLAGTAARDPLRNPLVKAHINDLSKVTRWYRWLGFFTTLMLVCTFPVLLLLVYLRGFSDLSILAGIFEGVLFVLIKTVFRRIDSYESMLKNLLFPPDQMPSQSIEHATVGDADVSAAADQQAPPEGM